MLLCCVEILSLHHIVMALYWLNFASTAPLSTDARSLWTGNIYIQRIWSCPEGGPGTGIFKSSLGDSNVKNGLRTTALETTKLYPLRQRVRQSGVWDPTLSLPGCNLNYACFTLCKTEIAIVPTFWGYCIDCFRLPAKHCRLEFPSWHSGNKSD